jgi:hypothetical protein
MKCISVAQPWAWAILAGLQEVEYRCYPTDHRGDLLIHASIGASDWARKQLASFGRRVPTWDELPFGRVIGLVDLWDCERGGDGIWNWRLREPRFVKPFRLRAGRRLFDVDDKSVEILTRKSPGRDWRYGFSSRR